MTKKKYIVSVPIVAAKTIDVFADSPEEAIVVAKRQMTAPSVCHQCSEDIELGDAKWDEVTTDNVSGTHDTQDYWYKFEVITGGQRFEWVSRATSYQAIEAKARQDPCFRNCAFDAFYLVDTNDPVAKEQRLNHPARKMT